MKEWLKRRGAALFEDLPGQLIRAVIIVAFTLLVTLYLWLEDTTSRTMAMVIAIIGAVLIAVLGILVAAWLQIRLGKPSETARGDTTDVPAQAGVTAGEAPAEDEEESAPETPAAPKPEGIEEPGQDTP